MQCFLGEVQTVGNELEPNQGLTILINDQEALVLHGKRRGLYPVRPGTPGGGSLFVDFGYPTLETEIVTVSGQAVGGGTREIPLTPVEASGIQEGVSSEEGKPEVRVIYRGT